MKKPMDFLLLGGLLAWAVDFLFWKKAIGISFLIWVALAVVVLLVLLWREKVRAAPSNIAWAVLALVFALTVCFRKQEFTMFLGVMLSLVCLTALAGTLRTGNAWFYRLGDWIEMGFNLLGAAFSRTPEVFRRSEREDGGNAFAWKMVVKQLGLALLGVLLVMPVLALLAALLASADPIFGDRLKAFFEALNIENIIEYLFRFFYVLILAYGFIGVLLHAVQPKWGEKRPDPNQPLFGSFLPMAMSAAALTCINLLFASFVAVQFQYFFGGQANIHVSGYTYSEYAVRGFNELVIVVVMSLAIYWTLAAVSNQRTTAQRNLFRVLVSILFGLVLVMLVSAWQRLGLYEAAYGFTRLRTQTHIFIPWLGVFLLVTLALELIGQRGRFALALVVAVFAFGLTFGVLNVDGFIARQNIARAEAGEELDRSYLTSLSTDAVPVVYAAYQKAEKQELRDGLGATLACWTAQQEEQKPQPWQSFHFSDLRARQLLLGHASEWQQYQTDADRVLIGGKWQPCIDYDIFWGD
jgi:hypothetical protein